MISESLHISTRQCQTPDKVMGTLCAERATQKVFDGFVYGQYRREPMSLNKHYHKFAFFNDQKGTD